MVIIYTLEAAEDTPVKRSELSSPNDNSLSPVSKTAALKISKVTDGQQISVQVTSNSTFRMKSNHPLTGEVNFIYNSILSS